MRSRFRFHLAPLLDSRERAEREKKHIFEASRAAAEAHGAELQRFAGARTHCAGALAEIVRTGGTRDAALYDGHLRALDRAIERENRRGAELERACELARDELAVANRERRVIEKLRERRRRAFEAAQARQEELEIDEGNARLHAGKAVR
ncbi:MAG: flagellar export protein FliJ [Candidatus Cybelea sp.]